MSQPDPNIGRRIKHYQITRKLGEGGIGQVYQAEHLHLGKAVALKILKQELSRNAELRVRFLQEAQISAQIAHENIVEILDFGETMHGECFLVMEMLNGKTLAQALDENQGPMSTKQVAHIGIQICAALYAAHARSAVHRDLKPENIYLVEYAGQKDFVKVLDFGLAKLTQTSQEHALTTIGKVLGTPYFMSPEQTVGDPVDARTDIYSLGVVMYQIATHTLPFTGKTIGEVMYKQVHQPPPAPKSRNAKIDSHLAAVILNCLQKEKEKRYPSMLELAKGLAIASGLEHQFYFSQRATITRRSNDSSVAQPSSQKLAPEMTSASSWSVGTPMPDEIKALRAASGLPSESQIATVHIQSRKRQAWLIPVAVLMFISTIALLVLLTR
jgi:eukaryotic-like serine/threonine-protein kinase